MHRATIHGENLTICFNLYYFKPGHPLYISRKNFIFAKNVLFDMNDVFDSIVVKAA